MEFYTPGLKFFIMQKRVVWDMGRRAEIIVFGTNEHVSQWLDGKALRIRLRCRGSIPFETKFF